MKDVQKNFLIMLRFIRFFGVIGFVLIFCVTSRANDSVKSISDQISHTIANNPNLKNDQNTTNEVIFLIRKLQALIGNTSGSDMAECIPVLVKCSLLVSSGNGVEREAGITMAGIGYKIPDVINAYATLLFEDRETRAFVLRSLEQNTRNNRDILLNKFGHFSALYIISLVFGTDMKNSTEEGDPLFDTYWAMLGTPVEDDVINSCICTAFMVDNCSAQTEIMSTHVRVKGLRAFSRRVSGLFTDVSDYREEMGKVKPGSLELKPFISKILRDNYLLMRRDQSEPWISYLGNTTLPYTQYKSTVWREVSDFSPAESEELDGYLVNALNAEIDAMYHADIEKGGWILNLYTWLPEFKKVLGKKSKLLLPNLIRMREISAGHSGTLALLNREIDAINAL